MFKITADYVTDGRCVGLAHMWDDDNLPPLLVKFRLFDDDMNLYYEGVMTSTDDCDEDGVFAPLDWGTHYAGCTMLYVFEKGEWSRL